MRTAAMHTAVSGRRNSGASVARDTRESAVVAGAARHRPLAKPTGAFLSKYVALAASNRAPGASALASVI